MRSSSHVVPDRFDILKCIASQQEICNAWQQNNKHKATSQCRQADMSLPGVFCYATTLRLLYRGDKSR